MSAAAPCHAAEVFGGIPRIVDGDTLEVEGKKIRLYGIDAPESKQSCRSAAGQQYTCGLGAAEKLREKVGGDPVRCEQRANDQYGRSVAVCRTPKFELNEWMVSEGLAVAYRQYGLDYVKIEDEARAAKRGLWSGEFDVPADWRKERRIEQLEKSLSRNHPSVDPPLGRSAASLEPPQQQQVSQQQSVEKAQQQEAVQVAAQQAQMACPNILIKGNISSNGSKIYHKPGDRAYTSTIIDISSGERYFCSEAEAQKAGWRASK